jgi:hypothetical protein
VTGFVSTTGLTNVAGFAAVTVFAPGIAFISDAGFTLETVLIFIDGLGTVTKFTFAAGLTLTSGFEVMVGVGALLTVWFFFSLFFFTSVVGFAVFADKVVPFADCWLAFTTGLLASVLGFLMFDTFLSLPKTGNAVSNDMPAAVARPKIHSRFINN